VIELKPGHHKMLMDWSDVKTEQRERQGARDRTVMESDAMSWTIFVILWLLFVAVTSYTLACLRIHANPDWQNHAYPAGESQPSLCYAKSSKNAFLRR
jgi:hypothetical protein